ncbi:MAG: hypothetical protein Q9190_003637 [Brigantiaea leucoxantha]
MISTEEHQHSLTYQSSNWPDSVFFGPTGARWLPLVFWSPGRRGTLEAPLPSQELENLMAQTLALQPSNKGMTIQPLPLDPRAKDTPLPAPKKYAAFSARDSRAIEAVFQKLADDDNFKSIRHQSSATGNLEVPQTESASETVPNYSANSDGTPETDPVVLAKVPVNEDFLFDVDVEKRELAPTYWLGPVYDVRRGSWFYHEGSTLRPCEENLANQLEEGFLKVKPWRYETAPFQRSVSQSRLKATSHDVKDGDGNTDGTGSSNSLGSDQSRATEKENPANMSAKFKLQTHRLFGTYMNSVVTYQDATVAWILTDDLLSRMSSTVYQRFAGGGHLGGTKVVRGFSEFAKGKDKKLEAEKASDDSKLGTDSTSISQKRRSAPPKIDSVVANDKSLASDSTAEEKDAEITLQSKLAALERQMSSIVTSPELEDPVKQDEQARKGAEDEIEKDYQEADGDDPGREIEHLILVTHGIGQRLGLRVENLNFIRDVNKFRKTLKGVYDVSPDLQALNSELDKLPKNCRVQVLPVVWRHLLDFPKQSFKQNSKEQDLTDADAFGEEEMYPSLEDITVEGVPGIRNLITDLALDILLYQSAYREHIAGIVQRECNRIYALFVQRNPSFSGKVSLVGHSLGSAILFDILCRQKHDDRSSLARNKRHSRRVDSLVGQGPLRDLGLNFDVVNFFCLGSPLGLYQMLKGRKIAARGSFSNLPVGGSPDSNIMDDLFGGAASQEHASANDSDSLSVTVSAPKCEQLFNIFHPADAIAYRIEPLISPAMSSLKPQPLPYTKKGIFAPGQGFTGIGARVGQSVSGFWSNITSGVANSLLNRSLGITGDGQTAPSNSVSGPVAPRIVSSLRSESSSKEPESEEQHPPTLIDSEIETLYSGFEKRRKSQQSDEGRDLGERPEWRDADVRARKLQREEAKVRALNSNGRVDFSIQE